MMPESTVPIAESATRRADARRRIRTALGPQQVSVGGEGRLQRAIVPSRHIADACAAMAGLGATLCTMVATDDRAAGMGYGLHYIFSMPVADLLIDVSCDVRSDAAHYPSVTPRLPAAHWYEREARDLFGVVPIGHPDPRRLVLHDDWPRGYHPLRKDVDGTVAPPRAEEHHFPFREIQGEGINEVPVGPIHAGIIEPGHFRFSVVGERIVHLEARLFYVHRGIEKICEGLPVERALEIVERICGVCTLSHSVAYCQAVESIAGCVVPPRAQVLRMALLELERLYNHIGEVGNICAGVGLSYGAMTGARLKDELQRLAERLTGSRYLRGTALPGGLRLDLDAAAVADLRQTVRDVRGEFTKLAALLQGTESLIRRLEGIGVVPRQVALDLGAVGVAARASGVARDIRLNHPYGFYREHPPTLITETSGDVQARFMVRVREADDAAKLIGAVLEKLSDGEVRLPVDLPAAGGQALGWTESPRGEHVHWLRLGSDGRVDRLRVRAASFCNWPLAPLAAPGNMIPDFPLINKSFELCYSCLDR
jgi:Ni,Fe-hydrogenase III large subunit/Ni,Fe-hydrogenase III component G